MQKALGAFSSFQRHSANGFMLMCLNGCFFHLSNSQNMKVSVRERMLVLCISQIGYPSLSLSLWPSFLWERVVFGKHGPSSYTSTTFPLSCLQLNTGQTSVFLSINGTLVSLCWDEGKLVHLASHVPYEAAGEKEMHEH